MKNIQNPLTHLVPNHDSSEPFIIAALAVLKPESR